MRCFALLPLVLLAGCMKPGELRRDGARTEYTLRLPPEAAARCIVRNAEEYSGGFQAQLRPGTQAGEFEVHVRTDVLVAIALVEPRGNGSSATIRRSTMPYLRQSIADAMAKGC